MTDRSSTRVQVKEDGCGKGCSLRRTEGKMNDGEGLGGAVTQLMAASRP